MILISSCLTGLCATWNARSNSQEVFYRLLQSGGAIPLCPEQMGGLPTPRPPAEITGGSGADVLDGRARVMTSEGADVTDNYLRGAHEALKLAQAVKPDLIVLKERSPSCGSRLIYDGSFTKNLVPGEGVTTALLRREGFTVVSDEEYLSST